MTALRPVLLIFLVAGAAAAPAGAPVPIRRPTAPAAPALYSLIGPDYKKPQDVPDTLFNPFKVEATNELGQRKGAAVNEQSVAAAVAHRSVSGVVYAASGGSNQVIIGDQVFRVGDELTFPAADGATESPLVAGATVTLREVNKNSLVFDFTAEGETPRRAIVSLRNFWRP